jgi:acyl carrier protein
MDIELAIKQSVAEKLFLNIEEIKLTDRFISDYDIDSLDLTEITMDLESKLNIDISLNYLTENLRTVQDLINLVTKIVNGEVLPISKESGCGRYGNLIKDEK